MERKLNSMLVEILSSGKYSQETKDLVKEVIKSQTCSIEAKTALIQACKENK